MRLPPEGAGPVGTTGVVVVRDVEELGAGGAPVAPPPPPQAPEPATTATSRANGTTRMREGSQARIHRVATPLPELLEQGGRVFAGRAARERVRIEVEAADVIVCVDRTRMRQALDNLIDNAIRHSPAGAAVRITGRTSGDTLTITVADAGPGFASDVLPNVFEPFARGAGSAYEGSGLGLAIVALIAEAHDGAAIAGNGADGGAQVTLTLAAAVPRPPVHGHLTTH